MCAFALQMSSGTKSDKDFNKNVRYLANFSFYDFSMTTEPISIIFGCENEKNEFFSKMIFVIFSTSAFLRILRDSNGNFRYKTGFAFAIIPRILNGIQ